MQATELAAQGPATPAERSTSPSLLGRVFSYPLALAIALTMLITLTVVGRFNDPDLWWHLKVGEIVWNTHSVPVTDLFSFTAPGHPWPPHEWLSEFMMYSVFKAAGYVGLMTWLAGCASIAYLLVYRLCWELSGSALVGLRGAVVAWLFGTTGFSMRPQVLGYGFLAAELLVLELARTRNPRWLWTLPPLFAVWVNCHGSYFLGLALLGIYFASSFTWGSYGLFVTEEWNRRLRWNYGLILLVSVAALCINPVGFRLLLFPFQAMFHMQTSLGLITEWQPPSVGEPRTLALLGSLTGVFALCMATRKTLTIRELLMLLMAGGLAIQHVRMMFPFGIVIAPILCRFGVPTRRNRGITGANIVMIACCIAAIVHYFPTTAALEEQVRKTSPVDAVNFVKSRQLAGPMLNDYGMGGYLLWALPEHKVFVDGRAEVYDSVGVMDAYRRWAYLEEDPKLLLEKYNIRFCFLSKDSPMNMVLPYLGWKKIYSDQVATIFTR